MIRNIPAITQIGPFPDVFVSDYQGLLCNDIEGSSPMHGTAWIRKAVALHTGHVNRQNSHQTLKERIRCFTNGESGVAHAQPDVGRPIAFHPEIALPAPSDRLHPGQPDFARPGIGGPIAFQAPSSVHGKDTSRPREVHIGGRHWYIVDYSEQSHEPKMISKGITRIQRSEPHFPDVDGACQ